MTLQNITGRATLARLGAQPAWQIVGTKGGLNGLSGFAPGISQAGMLTRIKHNLPYGCKGIKLVYSGLKVTSAIETSQKAGGGLQAVSAIPVAAGTGYAIGDTIVPTVAANQFAPTVVVTSLSGSTVTGLGIVDGGMFGLYPAAALAQNTTSGSGTGCTVTFTCAPYVCGFHMGFEQVWNTQTAYGTGALTGVIKLTQKANFNGPNSNIMCPVGDFFETDPIIVDIAAGTDVGTRLWSNGFGFHGGRLLSGNDGVALNEYSNYSSMTDYAWGSTFPNQITLYNNSGIQPIAILGLLDTPKPSFVFIGDSISYGIASSGGVASNDTGQTSTNHMGWLEKAATNQVAWTNFSASGDRVVNYLTANQNLRLNAIQYLRPSHVVDTMAVNDFVAGSSFATFQSQKIAYWTKLRGLGVKEIWISTCTPVTTSTDVWATVGNQTVTAANTAIQAWNAWVRTLSNVTPYGVTKVLDVMAVVESSATSGKWAVGMTADGTHHTTAGHNAVAAALTSQFAGVTL